MKRKILLILAFTFLLVCVFAITTNASSSSVHNGKIDLNATVTLDDGTVCPLFDGEGNALIWYLDASNTLKSIRADDSRVIYKCTYKFNVGNSTVGTKEAYEVSDMWIALESGNISKAGIVVLNLMDDDVLTNNNANLGKPVNCVKTIQWANKNLEYAFLRLDTVAIQQQAFAGCTKLKYINIEDLTELRQIGGSQPFSGSTALFKGETLDLTGTKLVTVSGEGSFNGVPFVDVKFPTSLSHIHNWCLQGTGLISFAFPENVTAVNGSQFKNCSHLQSIYINNKVTSIQGDAFLNCNALKNIFFVGSLDELNTLLDNTSTSGNTPLWSIAGDNRENLISYENYLKLTDKSGSYFVYDYSYCEAYNNSIHDSDELIAINYPDGFDFYGVSSFTCSRCSLKTYERAYPLISALGYSSGEADGRMVILNGYLIDTSAVDAYNSVNGVNLEIGIFFATPEAVGNSKPTSIEGFPHLSNNGENIYSSFNYIIRFPEKGSESYARYASAEFIASAYLYDGTEYRFFQGNSDEIIESTLINGFTTTTAAKITGDDHIEHIGEWVITPATCTTPASKERVCDICKEVETVVDESAPGHVWGQWQEGFLYVERSCTVNGCREAQKLDYQNITSSVLGSASFEGQAWANNAPGSLFDGNWDDRGIAAKGCDVATEIVLKAPTYIDRIYVKGVGGNPSKFTVSVLYEDGGDYVAIGSGSFLTSAENESANRNIPYAVVDSSKKVLSVKVKVTNSSYGSDLWEEVALVKLPDTSSYTSKETVTLTYNTGIGSFTNDFDYERFVTIGGICATHPTPISQNNSKLFTGWYTDINCTIPLEAGATYSSDVTLYAGWADNTACNDGTNNHQVESWEIITPASCSAQGIKSGICTICAKAITSSIETLPHTATTVSGVPANCIEMGVSDEIICAVCGTHISGGELLNPTGIHTFNDDSWTTVLQATKYTNGLATAKCAICSADGEKVLPYTVTADELSALDVGIKYTGGKYTNAIFTNIAPLGRVYVSSFFNGTKGGYMLDSDTTTFWSADTYIDGANYTSDYIVLDLPTAYDIGVISLIIPNYASYNLGTDCFVSYDIEYWDETTQCWTYLGTVSDKDAQPLGANCKASITLDAPITAQSLRAKISHASRYASATIYELEVFAQANDFEYAIESVVGQASVSISGKYNDWVSGGEAIVDGELETGWLTDIRYGGPTWALLEFSKETYIACIQIAIKTSGSRQFTLEVCENGEWIQLGGTYACTGTVGGNIISNANSVSTFNIDVEKTISKIRFNVVSDPGYWECYVYEITPYSVVGAVSDNATTECKHILMSAGNTVPPSCDSVGYTLMVCSGCGAEFRTNAKDILSHSFGEYTVKSPATSTTVGTKVAECASCNAISTVTYEESYEAPVVTPYLHNAPAAWAQTYDDGNYSDTYEWVIPQLQKYGYRATALLSITYANTHVSAWNERLNSGVFDLGSHSYNHMGIYNGDVSYAELLSDVVVAQYWFRSNFIGQKFITFAAPNGATSDAVAHYLTSIFAANRNGGQGYAFYNVISDLEDGRSAWGNLNSYISKADQTEGDYVFTDRTGSTIYTLDENGIYVLNSSYANKNVNYVFDEDAGTFVNKGISAGTYYYVSDEYRYEFRTVGSYNLVNGNFVFVNDNSGTFRLVKATMGSYEQAIDTLVSKGAFTVECIHSLGSGSIYSSYNSTISKFEYLAKKGVWAGSYQDLVLYLKEAQSAQVNTVERTDASVTISVTDGLDDYMFDHALTVKVDISDSWADVTVTQNGVEIPLVDISTYRASKNMSNVSCAIEDGYIYIDIIPNGGEVVITANATITGTDDNSAELGTSTSDILG